MKYEFTFSFLLGKAFHFVNSNEEEPRKNINISSDGKLEDVFCQHNHKVGPTFSAFYFGLV